MSEKRNVMWRACLDLQRIMEEMELNRAEIRGKRKRHENISESIKKASRSVRTRNKKSMDSVV
jgi:hypothetical protein